MSSRITSAKKFLMWMMNPAYDAEMLLQIQLKNPAKLQSCMNVLKESFIPDNRAPIADTEIHIYRENGGINIVLQPVYDSTTLMVSSINTILNCRVSYRHMIEQVFDLQAILDDYKNTILRNFDGYPQKSSFTIDVKTGKKYGMNCVKQLILLSGGTLTCQQNKLELEGTVNIRNVQCMKNIMISVQ